MPQLEFPHGDSMELTTQEAVQLESLGLTQRSDLTGVYLLAEGTNRVEVEEVLGK